MPDCSKTEEFAKEYRRMCKCFASNIVSCPLYDYTKCFKCADEILSNTHIIVPIVQKWSDENPRKTRQSEFLKHYPKTKLNDDGIIKIKPCMIDVTCPVNGKCCIDCIEEYWLSEVE